MDIPQILTASTEYAGSGGSDELKAIIGSMAEGLIVLDMQGNIVRVNPAIMKTYGLKDIAEAPKTIQELTRIYECAEQLAVPAPVERSMRGEAVFGYETTFRRTDTGQVWAASENSAPIRNKDGEIVGVVLTIADITQRKRVEEELRQSEHKYRHLAESIPGIVFFSRPDGFWEYVNKYWYEFTGSSPDATLGFGWKSRVHPGEAPFGEVLTPEMAAKGKLEYEVRLRGRDERYHWFRARRVPQKDEEGRLAGWLGICTDIDEQKKQDLALRHTQKLECIGGLAGGIAHDFNNLLTTVIGNASLLLAQTPPSCRNALQDIMRAGERGAELTKQLLDYAGKGKIVPQALNMNDVIQQMSDLLRASIPKSIELVITPGENLPEVRGDAGQIQQLVMNLAVNGAEAIGEHATGALSISTGTRLFDEPTIGFLGETADAGLYAWIEVADSGIGMDEESLARIFDPFFTTKFLGRGLGLSAAQGIARTHNAFFEVESQPGSGSRFRILFPAIGRSVAPAEPLGQVGDGCNAILIVDDDAMTRRMMELTLGPSGYKLYAAGNGREALDIFSAHAEEICLVLLDLAMPVMSGNELLPLLQQRRPGIRVLLTSGYDEIRAKQALGEFGTAIFLQKPYTASRLLDAVKTVLR